MKFIKGFDGLRCYSVLLVIITHLGTANHFAPNTYLRDNVFFFFSGGAGVNIFFAISGFLITTLILNEIHKTGRFNIKYFFARRFIRLLPPIIPFYLALYFFMELGFVRYTIYGIGASALYLYNFVPKAKVIFSTELSHTWSLAVEEQFYLIWAFVFYYFRAYKKQFATALLLLFACVCFIYLLPALTISIDQTVYPLEEVFFVTRWTLPAIGPILIGALVGMANFYNTRGERALAKRNGFGWFAILIFLSPFYTPSFLHPVMFLFHALGASLLLLWNVNNQEHKIIGWLEWAPIAYLGKISYGLYIWQGFFVRTGPGQLPKIWVHDYPYSVILTFMIAILSYELYEKRVLRFKRHYKV